MALFDQPLAVLVLPESDRGGVARLNRLTELGEVVVGRIDSR